MKRYQLFSEYCDAILWGNDLSDAIMRNKELPQKLDPGHLVDDGHTRRIVQDPKPTLKVKTVLGARDTSKSTRGQWRYESAVVELEGGKVVEVDARLLEELKP